MGRLLLIGVVLLAGCEKRGGDPDAAGDRGTAPRGSGDPTGLAVEEVTFSDVMTAYDLQKNPLAGDAKFKGKRLRVSGVKVYYISRTAAGRGYIAPMSIMPSARLEPEPSFFFYLGDERSAASIEKGGTYTVEGTCEGYRRDDVFRGVEGMNWRVEFTGCVVKGKDAAPKKK